MPCMTRVFNRKQNGLSASVAQHPKKIKTTPITCNRNLAVFSFQAAKRARAMRGTGWLAG